MVHPEQRMSDTLNWRTIELVLEAGVFLFMGLELKDIVGRTSTTTAACGTGAWLASPPSRSSSPCAPPMSRASWLQSRRPRPGQTAAGGHQRPPRRHRDESRHRRHHRAARTASARATGPAPRTARAARAMRQRRVDSMRTRLTRAFADLDYYQASPLGWRHGTISCPAGMRGVVTLRRRADAAFRHTPAVRSSSSSLSSWPSSACCCRATLPWRALARSRRHGGRGHAVEQTRLDDELRAAAASALTDGGSRVATARPSTPISSRGSARA